MDNNLKLDTFKETLNSFSQFKRSVVSMIDDNNDIYEEDDRESAKRYIENVAKTKEVFMDFKFEDFLSHVEDIEEYFNTDGEMDLS